SEDPPLGGLANFRPRPRLLHPYSYTGNNPLRYKDLYGLDHVERGTCFTFCAIAAMTLCGTTLETGVPALVCGGAGIMACYIYCAWTYPDPDWDRSPPGIPLPYPWGPGPPPTSTGPEPGPLPAGLPLPSPPPWPSPPPPGGGKSPC